MKPEKFGATPGAPLPEFFGLAKTIEARKEILIEQRDLLAARMEEMQKTLERLNYKIEVYEKALLKKEKEMVQVEELMAGD